MVPGSPPGACHLLLLREDLLLELELRLLPLALGLLVRLELEPLRLLLLLPLKPFRGCCCCARTRGSISRKKRKNCAMP
jgi:hypothetical protein